MNMWLITRNTCEIRVEMAKLASAGLKAAMAGDEAQIRALRRQHYEARVERDRLLQADGLTQESFAPSYHCSRCQDTGRAQGRVCDCVLRSGAGNARQRARRRDTARGVGF